MLKKLTAENQNEFIVEEFDLIELGRGPMRYGIMSHVLLLSHRMDKIEKALAHLNQDAGR